MKEGFLRGVNYEDPVTSYRGEKIKRIASLLNGAEVNAPLNLAVDVFYSIYLPFPILKDGPHDDPNYRVLSSLLASHLIHELRSRTMLDGFLSSLAAGRLLIELVQHSEEQVARRAKEKEGEGADARAAVERAITITLHEINAVRDLKQIMEGLQPGTLSDFSLEEHAADVLKLARDAEIRRILEILRGMKPWELGVERKKRRFKHGEIMGYEYGRDIERVVRSNLLLPEDIFFLRYTQRRLLLYDKRIEESVGPIYVLLDKCLPGDSSIIDEAGAPRPISSISRGDRVISPTLAGSSWRIIEAEVVEVLSSKREVLGIITEKGVLRATRNHIIPVINGNKLSLIPAGLLRPGDLLLRFNEKAWEPRVSVVKKLAVLGYQEVFDIRLDRNHLFIADGFVVHNSGSMEGIKMAWAKAVALALYMKAIRSGRQYYLRFFDSQPYDLMKIGRSPRAEEAIKLMEYIARIKGSGGTDISRAIITATTDIRSGAIREGTDIILITDGIDRITENIVRNNLAKADARLISVMVQGDNPSLRKISYKYFSVIKLDRGDVIQVAEA